MADKLRVTQIKSTISHIARNRATVRALGLKRIGHTVEIPDNPATRGMVRQVRFLVSVEEVADAGSPKGAPAGRIATEPSEDRGDAPTSHPSEDSQETA
jgi:large subunit ribosomal protein L30